MADGAKICFDSLKIRAKVVDSLRPGLSAVGEAVLRESDRHVPVAPDGGVLKESGRVTVSEESAWVSYGTPYAVRLHEHPEYRFSDAPERGAKWLENAAKTVAPMVSSIVADSIAEK